MTTNGPANEDLAGRLGEVEKSLVTREKAEEIAASAALDVLKFYEKEVKEATQVAKELGRALEKRQFAQRVAESLSTRVCLQRLNELTEGVDEDELKLAVEARMRDAFSSQLESPEFAEKLKELVGSGGELQDISKRLFKRLVKIEQEGLPQLVEEQVDEKLEEKLSAISADTITAKEEELVRRALAAKLDGQALQQQVLEVARSSIREIVNTPEFKSVLDNKFKVMVNYLSQEVIPKQIKRLMGG